MKMPIKVTAVFLCIAGIIYFAGYALSIKQKTMKEGIICFEEKCFSVEVAKTYAQQQQGLMYRTGLGEKRGMLFIFQKAGNYPFWMMNTRIPLDIIWLDSDKKVVFIKKNAQPCIEVCDSINPEQSASYVLEINGGVADQIGLEIGDRAEMGVDNK